MKTLPLVIVVILFTFLILMTNHPSYAPCLANPDWYYSPCYAIPGFHVTKEQMQKDWSEYYQYKGSQWMAMKRAEMNSAITNGTLKEWAQGSLSNYDVWFYYYLNDKAPTYPGSFIINQDQSPLKQFKSGIAAKDVKCENNLQLIIKAEVGYPVCVKPSTATKLVERGWGKYQTGVDALGYAPIQLLNVTTSPQPIILGMPFYMNVTVINHQNSPITYYGGCVSPLSITFDNIKTYTEDFHCLAISKNLLGQNEQVVVHSEKIGTLYNATGPDTTYATIKFSYQVNGTQSSFFSGKQLLVKQPVTLWSSNLQ